MVRSLRVKAFSVTPEMDAEMAKTVTKVTDRMKKDKWKRLIYVKDKDETISINTRYADGKLVGLMLVAYEPGDSAAFVNVVGDLDLGTLLRLAGDIDSDNLEGMLDELDDIDGIEVHRDRDTRRRLTPPRPPRRNTAPARLAPGPFVTRRNPDQKTKRERNTPAATAEPITPATLGAMACMIRKFCGSSLRPHHLADARRVGHRRHAGRADDGVDLVAREQVHELGEEHAGGRGHAEAQRAQHGDLHRVRGQEAAGVGRGAHAQAQQDGHDVDQRVARGLGQALGDPALLQQVAEEQEAEQADGARRDGGADAGRPTTGNMMRTRLLTGRDGFMRISRSLRVVSSLMIGGWITGTRAM